MNWWSGNASTPTPSLASTPASEAEAADAADAPKDPDNLHATRSKTSSASTPYTFLSSPLSRRDIARERISRTSRSRTPSPRPQESTVFSYPATSVTMDEETIQRLMEAAIRATQSSNTQQVQSLRKPDLPPFDKNNVEIWVKRVEAAYARVNCTNPSLKFAHLESKFEVNQDPIVDGYLFGPASDNSWTAFLNYLRTRYGPTTRDRALSVINGTPREGRTPSQLVAAMKEKAGAVTLDDILKEQLLKQLPQEVMKQIVDRVDKLSCDKPAKLADAWFHKDGKPLLSSDSTSVHNVDRPSNISNSSPTLPSTSEAASAAPAARAASFTTAFEDEEADADINAVRFRQGQKQSFNIQNREGARGRGRGRGSQSGRGRGGSNGNSNNNTNSYGDSSSYSSGGGAKKKKICNYHIRFGDKAEKCEEWCMLNPQKKAPKGKPMM